MTDGFDLQWTRPAVLFWLVVIVPYLVWYHHRSLSDFPRWQRYGALAMRTIAVTLLLLALTGLVLLSQSRQQMIVVAIDRSASVDESATKVADEWARQFQLRADQGSDVEIRFLDFDRECQNVSSDHDAPVQTVANVIEAEQAGATMGARSLATNLESAVRTAAASIPPKFVPKIVVISDGIETTGDVIAAASSQSVPVWTIGLPGRVEPEIQVAAIDAPAQVRQGEPFYIDVTVHSNVDATGFVDLYRGDIRIGDNDVQPMKIVAGENKFRVRQSVSAARQVTFAARLRGFADSDTMLDNNESVAVVSALGRPRVLMIDPDGDQTDAFRWAMEEQQIDVEVRPPTGVPNDLAELQGYECLLLSNVPATAMSMRQMDVIRTYVQDLGGGLIMLGGDQSFGLGGYYRTSLEEILPVRSDFEKEREKPSLAMVLVIDKSGSMGGEKIELAKDAARAAVELLGPRDSIGVIAFDGDAYWIADMQPASNRSRIIDDISTIDAGGGTVMYPAMDEAYRSLQSTSAKLKHCIMMTDGITAADDFEGLASTMAASRMTVSTVAMGQGASEELLEDIARIGGGRYYFCEDARTVPQVFAKETVEASKAAINELPFVPQLVRPTTVLDGIDMELAPLLLGYVVTRPKPTCEFVLATESGDPLLAWWRYGLGMTVAFTSDAKARWASEWLAWPDFGSFWAQVIRHAMRKNDSTGFFVDVATSDGKTIVQMDMVDDGGSFLSDRRTSITVIDPKLGRTEQPMTPTAPGRYEATFDSDLRGVYQLSLAATRSPGDNVTVSRGVAVGYPDELRLKPPDTNKLMQIADVSGGKFDASAEQILAPDDRAARQPIPVWPWLLMAAMVCFVVDVGLRRIDFGR